ncbi:transglutaminase family protein [Glaciimonas sp. CA11.2]|uniref:transglutaminase family protein n=1 Tax=unclassified Glaciimonas TaxID=2644401 RepID=UPI002AB5BA2C|nr:MULTISPECIES: transglutaminase family protein [unclassified Glaciimonas]MDY7545710.1 transglutaminase family protein [Glaciimonas sp. CA11.2]MEB0011642.1 transglutaminase family protein [Glaciimonas sp. Cout2]MEB0081439.1 transglutaminase family protein [Glaciimonas sp. Gout2]MEB0162615.1 transglutaminase family protein [Glaciimonas sp. CA11.2]
MAIRVALHHKTSYHYDRLVTLSPHEVRLRPAPHARTPILSYSLSVTPEDHFINWQQDPYGNYIGRFVFQEKSDVLEFTVDLIADMTVINPFDFFVEKYAETFPFSYPAQQKSELSAYLAVDEPGPLLVEWVAAAKRDILKKPLATNDFLVAINQRLQGDIAYLLRMEPGVQTPEDTLLKRSGSCRDSGWLLVQIMRQLGLAARFVSGYLIQLRPDQESLDGPSGTEVDFTDLHAWTEVYIPGAGWIGLDPTSGMLASEGHIPLACTAMPSSAAPVSGFTDKAEVTFFHEMTVTRIHEDPRVTKPYSEEDWLKIDKLGHQVDADLKRQDVRLTQGGEPTFVSVDDMDGAQWNTLAHGDEKRELAGQLMHRLKNHFAPGGMLHYGQGKWYPGEPLPRWALNIFWRVDGQPMWLDATLFSDENKPDGYVGDEAARFTAELVKALGLPANSAIAAYEDVMLQVHREQGMPVNVDPLKANLKASEERRRLARLLETGLGEIVGYVLPLKPKDFDPATSLGTVWRTSAWPLKREHLYLTEGDSPMGLRLPLNALPWVLPDEVPPEFDVDPFAPRGALPTAKNGKRPTLSLDPEKATKAAPVPGVDPKPAPREVIHTGLCIQVRAGRLHIFMPPVKRVEDYLALVTAVENTAAKLKLKLWIEGYPPPRDPRVKLLSVTPDPGVIEVNIHPAASWKELVYNMTTLYEEARLTRLGTEKFMVDGRHTGTGGGNHATLGGATAEDSPMLRRPDLLKSLITYWQNHPALSYLFSGTFIGPTSQAPRVDEARDDNLYELAIAFQQMDKVLPTLHPGDKPWMVDRLLRNHLVDLTGNTHRSEFSIDKLYSPDGPTGRLGLVEFRAFEMPPHERMSLLQMLLLRALVSRFWKQPYQAKLVNWGTALHDRWMLPHFVAQDIRDVAKDLRAAGYAFEENWFDPFIEFRFPRFGTVVYEGVEMELRQAIEPWNVLGEEMAAGGTARYVDSSVERMQLLVRGLTDGRHVIACNGRMLPLHPTGIPGEYVAGVRFRAWSPWSALHPTVKIHAPLTFDLVDTWSGRAIGGCTYHVVHPGGRSEATAPVNANAAEARRFARFWAHGHTPGPMTVYKEETNPSFPMTLDLRWHD